MKYVSILIPEPGPLGDTFFEASVLAMTDALLVNSPRGGNVETVFTPAIQRLFPLRFVARFVVPRFLAAAMTSSTVGKAISPSREKPSGTFSKTSGD